MTDFPKQVTAEPSAESGEETQEGGQENTGTHSGE